jgi:hypothetical protein
MSYSAKVTFKYDSTWEHKIGSSFGEDILPEEHVTYEFPVEDATSYQMFRAFGKFMYMVGHNQEGIARGAASVAFGEDRSTEDMQKTADYFDLILSEVHGKKVIELEDKIYAQEKEIRDLKAKLSRFKQPDNPQYTDEEMDALCYQKEITADILKSAEVVCKDCGSKYGHYSVGCSSTWTGTCNVCGQEKSITEVRDWNYLKEGINKLSK